MQVIRGGAYDSRTLGQEPAVRFPAEIADETGLAEGQKIEMFSQNGEIVIRPEPTSALKKIFAGGSAEEWRELYAGSDEWAPFVGGHGVEE